MLTYKDLDNFWYYHKFKLLGAILVIVAAVFIIKTGGGIKPDVELAYVTDGRIISQEAEEYLRECFAPKITDVNGDKNRNTAFVPLQGPRIDMEFVAEGSQIVLMDGFTLEKFINQGLFEPLDAYAAKLQLDFDKYPGVSAKADETGEVHTYAIPMAYIPFLLKIGFPSENYYLTVRAANTKDKKALEKEKNAYGIMDVLFEENAQEQ